MVAVLGFQMQMMNVEKGRVAGVVLAKGGEIDAPVVVSNADLKRTVRELVGEEHFSPETAELPPNRMVWIPRLPVA